MINEVRFKGNVFTYKRIINWAIIFALTSILILAFFYYKGYDILFQLIDYLGTSILLILIIVVSSITATFITDFIFGRIYGKEVVIRITEDLTLEINNGHLYTEIPLKQLKSISYIITNSVTLNRITIRADKNLYINAGSVLSGIPSKDIPCFLQDYYKHLKQRRNFKELQQYTSVKSKTTGTHICAPPNSTQLLKKRYDIKHVLSGLLISIIAIIVTIFILSYTHDDDPKNMVSKRGIKYTNSNYYLYNNEVYFHCKSGGYYKVRGSDPLTFKPLIKDGQYSSNMAVDKYGIYAGNEKIEALNLNNFEYIGGYYTKNTDNVYYKNHKIENADPETFQLFTQKNSNSAKYFYGYDKDHIFYKDKMLEDVNKSTFKFEKLGYNIYYATDGKKHFINGIGFPNKVNNKIWGSTSVDLKSLQLLQRKSQHSLHTLFADKNSIYYWDETKQDFFCITSSIPNLRAVKDGVYTNGNQTFYSKRKLIKRRKYGIMAYITLIVNENNKTVAKAKSGSNVVYETD